MATLPYKFKNPPKNKTKKQIKDEVEEIARKKKAKTNTSRKRNLKTIWICKEVLAATILSIPPPNSHPDPSPPPLLHLLLLVLFVQLRLLLLLLLPLHRNTILDFRNPANCYYYFFLRYKFKISPKKSKKKIRRKTGKKPREEGRDPKLQRRRERGKEPDVEVRSA